MIRTLGLVNLASVMERADEALLPGAYREIGAALHASPTGLGSLTLLRSLVQALCFPFAAYFAEHYNRCTVIAVGALLSALATFSVGLSSTFFHVAVSRALNGVGLAVVVPSIQSLVADATEGGNRGLAFGWLQFTGNIGSILGGICSVLLADTKVLGISGWRIAFHLIALLSIVVGMLVYMFAIDPRQSEIGLVSLNNRSRKPFNLIWSSTKETIFLARKVLRIPTFQVIVAQGVAGSFPWAALAFAAMWLELLGFSHEVTAVFMGIFVIAASFGGLFGGYMGDLLSRHLPNAGRIILAQISSFLAVPLAAALLLTVPADPPSKLLYGTLLFVMGFCISWNAPATNNPIFAEIVPPQSRASVYALDRSFESVLASFAPPVVGLLAQYAYGYVPISNSAKKKVEIDREDARALAKALYSSTGLPMAVCCVVYTFLYWTYPRDRLKAELEYQSNESRVENSGSSNEKIAMLELSSEVDGYNGIQVSEIEGSEESSFLLEKSSTS